MDAFPLYNSYIWLLERFMYPKIAEHFFTIAEKGHPIFQGFGDLAVLRKDEGAQELQAAFMRLVLLQVIVIYRSKHGFIFYICPLLRDVSSFG